MMSKVCECIGVVCCGIQGMTPAELEADDLYWGFCAYVKDRYPDRYHKQDLLQKHCQEVLDADAKTIHILKKKQKTLTPTQRNLLQFLLTRRQIPTEKEYKSLVETHCKNRNQYNIYCTLL